MASRLDGLQRALTWQDFGSPRPGNPPPSSVLANFRVGICACARGRPIPLILPSCPATWVRLELKEP
jgi:hypothetical protein